MYFEIGNRLANETGFGQDDLLHVSVERIAGQRDAEVGPLSLLALDPESTAQSHDQRSRDEETEPQAPAALPLVHLHPGETLEDPLLQFGSDSRAPISDEDGAAHDPNVDRRALGAELRGIVDQVPHRPIQQ